MLVEVTDDKLVNDSPEFFYDDTIEVFMDTDTHLIYALSRDASLPHWKKHNRIAYRT